jgi:hypothetical protein
MVCYNPGVNHIPEIFEEGLDLLRPEDCEAVRGIADRAEARLEEWRKVFDEHYRRETQRIADLRAWAGSAPKGKSPVVPPSRWAGKDLRAAILEITGGDVSQRPKEVYDALLAGGYQFDPAKQKPVSAVHMQLVNLRRRVGQPVTSGTGGGTPGGLPLGDEADASNVGEAQARDFYLDFLRCHRDFHVSDLRSEMSRALPGVHREMAYRVLYRSRKRKRGEVEVLGENRYRSLKYAGDTSPVHANGGRPEM